MESNRKRTKMSWVLALTFSSAFLSVRCEHVAPPSTAMASPAGLTVLFKLWNRTSPSSFTFLLERHCVTGTREVTDTGRETTGGRKGEEEAEKRTRLNTRNKSRLLRMHLHGNKILMIKCCKCSYTLTLICLLKSSHMKCEKKYKIF